MKLKEGGRGGERERRKKIGKMMGDEGKKGEKKAR